MARNKPQLRIGQTWENANGNGDIFAVLDIYLSDTFGRNEFTTFVKILRSIDGETAIDTVVAQTLNDWFETERFTLVSEGVKVLSDTTQQEATR